MKLVQPWVLVDGSSVIYCTYSQYVWRGSPRTTVPRPGDDCDRETWRMKNQIGLGQLRSHTCGYFERIAAGETIEVVRRGTPVARILPIAGDPTEPPVLRSVDKGMCRLDDLRSRAGRIFDRVAAGEEMEVIWRDRLVARLVPAGGGSVEASPSQPIRAGICDFNEQRRRAGGYVDRVAAGETIEVVRNGTVVARIVSSDIESRESA